MTRMCDCGKPARHEASYLDGRKVVLQCCECYVKEGNPPADWHSDCMIAFERLTSERRTK